MSEQSSWDALPPELLRLCFAALLRELHAGGPLSLSLATRCWGALRLQCRAWRAVAEEVGGAAVGAPPPARAARFMLAVQCPPARWANPAWCSSLSQLVFDVALASFAETPHLGAVPIRELWLPPLLRPSTPPDIARGCVGGAVGQVEAVLCSSGLRRRSGGILAAIHGVPVALLAVPRGAPPAAHLAALRRLTASPDSLPHSGGTGMAPFQPTALPPTVRHLDCPVPRHPFPLAAGLPSTLESLTLRCPQDLLVTAHLLGRLPTLSDPWWRGTLPRSWRRLAVHATRTAALDLDDLRLLPPVGGGSRALPPTDSVGSSSSTATTVGSHSAAGKRRTLLLAAPTILLSSTDPAHPGALAAPPVRSLAATLEQYAAVLAPVLAEADVGRLQVSPLPARPASLH